MDLMTVTVNLVTLLTTPFKESATLDTRPVTDPSAPPTVLPTALVKHDKSKSGLAVTDCKKVQILYLPHLLNALPIETYPHC